MAILYGLLVATAVIWPLAAAVAVGGWCAAECAGVAARSSICRLLGVSALKFSSSL